MRRRASLIGLPRCWEPRLRAGGLAALLLVAFGVMVAGVPGGAGAADNALRESTLLPQPELPRNENLARTDGLPQWMLDALTAAGVGGEGPRQQVVVLDPGHGGADAGAELNRIKERELNLDIAERVEEILEANGYYVILTRRDEGRSYLDRRLEAGFEPDEIRPDLHARTQLAQLADADAFVSIHSNGHPDFSVRGVEAWYQPSLYRDLAVGDANERLAEQLLYRVFAELFASGYEAPFLGVKDASCHEVRDGRCSPIYVLAPWTLIRSAENLAPDLDPVMRWADAKGDVLLTRGTRMPAALIEGLFVSNPTDASILRTNWGRQAIARGIAQGIIIFLQERTELLGLAALDRLRASLSS